MELRQKERSYFLKVVAFFGALALLITVVYLSPMGNHLSAENAIRAAAQTPDNWISFFIFLIVFTLGSWVLFPLTLTSVLTVIVFPFWKATLCSILGVALSATFSYLVGRHFLNVAEMPRFKKHVEYVRKEVERLSFWAIGALRLAPQPPFIATSVIAGSLKLSFPQYLLASILGLGPMIALGLILGSRAMSLLKEPSVITACAMGAALILVPLFLIAKKKVLKSKQVNRS